MIQDVIDVQSRIGHDLNARDISGRSFQKNMFLVGDDQGILDLQPSEDLKHLLGLEPSMGKSSNRTNFPSCRFIVKAARRTPTFIFLGSEKT